VPHGEQACAEVDVALLQPEQLTATKSQGQRAQPQRFQWVTSDCRNKSPGIIDREHPHFLAIKAAPLRGAAGAPATGLCVGDARPARARRCR
jgi:hypothetical protein